MLIDDILKQKYDLQLKLAEKNKFDSGRMADNAHSVVIELSKKRNIKLNYYSDYKNEQINKQAISQSL
ncbi:MAG: hypothetical protein A2X61_03745 [Ignavibacteria bacterium GWB2_35_12]|nr:MAG: hypothetical protein A2X63_00910 [Ignavibacteria bacterium GWA2_35_8]OGU40399.1 MAG: hypothetical protein A2X61_03745 [Ignavibacteria bacterium GWB2_35_12]OGU92192.1 MAG: hypothetical protein A2220_13685 [Ignavibacteria bacterium RIFOXYA2_FULL_35_10]OGV22535.1 MAG: hypothetical protein A2475_03420 [Ignavibacteria bacterium RIFOXYC2_FULL_35_21]